MIVEGASFIVSGALIYVDEIGPRIFLIHMTQDERWLLKYNEVLAFMEREGRNPSKHRIEEHDMLNWMKANRKLVNSGKMREDRMKLFEKLVEMGEKVRMINQYL